MTGGRGPGTGYRVRVPSEQAASRLLLPRWTRSARDRTGTHVALSSFMPKLTSFRQLEVWQLAMTLCENLYEVSSKLPRSEFDLRRQMRSASISIPANVAEGYKRRTRPAYINHISIAAGSQGELDTHLELAVRLKLLIESACAPVIHLTDRVGGMLWRLEESLRQAQEEDQDKKRLGARGVVATRRESPVPRRTFSPRPNALWRRNSKP